MTRVVFTIDGGRCPTVNDMYSEHWRSRQRAVQAWRAIGKAKARHAWNTLGPLATPIVAIATPLYRRGPVTDVGAILPAVKAVIDGAVDAKLIPDDSPKYVSSLLFESPELRDFDGLRLVLAEALGGACVACDLPLVNDEGLVFPTGRRLCAACLRTVEPYRTEVRNA